MAPHLLQLKNVQVKYGKAEALRGISMEISEGSIVTLIGANGAGKTTVLRSISGLIKLTAGEIWFGEERIDQVEASGIVRKGISHVPEGRRLFPYMTVYENLIMGAYSRKEHSAVGTDLKVVLNHFPRLNERLRQKGGSLSGGEQQMVAIGRALMSGPRLLLLDEPTLGLSPLLVKETAKIIKMINTRSKVGILLVEQNARMALSLAERGYVLETGVVALADDAKNLMTDEHVKKAYLGG
jgi:branched-chain amino acid transport system ATP-binding protein